jgi:hypothetical protein
LRDDSSHNVLLAVSKLAVLPTGRIFGSITQKGPHKKVIGRTNQRSNWGRIFTERDEKGPNFETALLPLFFPYKLIFFKLDFSQIFTLEWFKNWSNFDKTREKWSFLQRCRFFLYQQKNIFGQSGRILLERVGNTAN